MQEQWYDVYKNLAYALDTFYRIYREKSGERFFELCMQYPDEFFEHVGFAEKLTEKGWYRSLDPVHIFASFNRFGIHADVREAVLRFYYKLLNMDSSKFKGVNFDVFPYFPHLDLRQIAKNRVKESQQEIWVFLHALCSNDEMYLQKCFDENVNEWHGIGPVTLTSFMFWTFSDKYLSLDQYTCALLEQHGLPFQALKYNEYKSLLARGDGLDVNIYRNITHYAYRKKNHSNMSAVDLFQIAEFLDGKELEEFDAEFDAEIKKAKKLNLKKRQIELNEADPYPPKVKVQTSVYKRNPYVVITVLERANGICELCKSPAPFKRKSDGSPFLEIHHKKPLSEGGLDTIGNAVALCPNCHRKAHFGKESLFS